MHKLTNHVAALVGVARKAGLLQQKARSLVRLLGAVGLLELSCFEFSLQVFTS